MVAFIQSNMLKVMEEIPSSSF